MKNLEIFKIISGLQLEIFVGDDINGTHISTSSILMVTWLALIRCPCGLEKEK